MLEAADMWDRMADWEEQHEPGLANSGQGLKPSL
jgi:hypothetical protein